jgi:antitoxin (DNA-binding transcriptional repressor) of toxin-antitoxin stability system
MAIEDRHNGVMRVSVADAKNGSRTAEAVEAGKTVTICRRGVPVVDLVRMTKSELRERKFGTLRGKIKIIDPDWWKPMTDQEIEMLLEKGYY